MTVYEWLDHLIGYYDTSAGRHKHPGVALAFRTSYGRLSKQATLFVKMGYTTEELLIIHEPDGECNVLVKSMVHPPSTKG